MFQLLGRIAKLSSSSIGKKHDFCFSELRSLSTLATPYLLLDERTNWTAKKTSGESLVDLNLYDPRNDERLKIPDQNLPEELVLSMKIASSRGWVGMRNLKDSTFRLTNIFNPCASVSSRKVISLPPLNDSISHACCISLSASPNQQDCVVAVKSYSAFLHLCRPGDSDWTRIKVPVFDPKVTYSVRDQRFYLYMKPGEEKYEGPIDLIDTSSFDFPQVSLYERFPLSGMPKSRHEQISLTFNNQYMVESPRGDIFIVYWCEEFLKRGDIESTLARPSLKRKTTSTFAVFRQDHEQKIASYTEDIGDLCIFLGKNEAFCISATEYPGLKPNSVYFASFDAGYGFYDLSSNTIHVIDSPSFRNYYSWLAPLQ